MRTNQRKEINAIKRNKLKQCRVKQKRKTIETKPDSVASWYVWFDSVWFDVTCIETNLFDFAVAAAASPSASTALFRFVDWNNHSEIWLQHYNNRITNTLSRNVNETVWGGGQGGSEDKTKMKKNRIHQDQDLHLSIYLLKSHGREWERRSDRERKKKSIKSKDVR